MSNGKSDPVWNFNELRSLCSEMRAERINVFCKSFVDKFNYCDFYGRRCREVFDAFHKQPMAVFHGEFWEKTWFEHEAYFIAFCGVLHSTFDTFAQILNLSLFDIPLKEHVVTLAEIDKKEPSLSSVPWRTELQTFLDSDAFKYITALNNTLKHRHLLDHSYRFEWSENKDANLGFMVGAFSYKNDTFPHMWAFKVLELREQFSIPLVSVGARFNEYLKTFRTAGAIP